MSGDRSSRVNRGQLPPRLQESRQEDGAEFLQLRAKTEDALKNPAVQASRKYRTQARARRANTVPSGGRPCYGRDILHVQRPNVRALVLAHRVALYGM